MALRLAISRRLVSFSSRWRSCRLTEINIIHQYQIKRSVTRDISNTYLVRDISIQYSTRQQLVEIILFWLRVRLAGYCGVSVERKALEGFGVAFLAEHKSLVQL